MTRIELLGIDGAALTGEQSNRIRGCVAAAVSRRHRPLVEGLCDRLLEITPLARMFAQVEEELTRGDVAVLAIPAGPGKTTLATVLLGLRAPTAGTCRVDR